MKSNRTMFRAKRVLASSIIGLFSLAGLASSIAKANDVEGSWDANLKLNETITLPLTIHLKRSGKTMTGTLDTPTQGGFGIPMSSLEVEDSELVFDIANLQIHYEGKYDKSSDSIKGTFIQGKPFPLNFSRQAKPIEYAKTSAPEDIVGRWSGRGHTAGGPLAFVIEVSQKDGKYLARAQSPDQHDSYIPVDSFEFNQGKVIFTIDDLQFRFEGGLSKDKSSVVGNIKQGPAIMKIKMDKKPLQSKLSARPQTPKSPFDYSVEEVSVLNQSAKVTLAGTLTKPKGKIKATAILITGSGPQDRDETILRHKPFAVIADHFANQGIAVLRLDDRGVGRSTGNFDTATSEDFASDTQAALAYLKARNDIPDESIGLIGHSEGGMIASMVAAENKDVAFVIMMAGPGVNVVDLYVEQRENVLMHSGVPASKLEEIKKLDYVIFDQINRLGKGEKINDKTRELIAQIAKILGIEEQRHIDAQVDGLTKTYETPWFRYFLQFDPQPYIKKIRSPLLAINGSLDIQVEAEQNLSGIEETLKSVAHPDFKTVELKGLNHLFQTAKTGAIAEYDKIEETISPQVLNLMSDWIEQRFLK